MYSASTPYHHHYQYLYNGDEECEHPRPPFYVDLIKDGVAQVVAHGLTTKRFIWYLYLNSSPWGRALVPEVRFFALCWLDDRNRPGFHVMKHDGQQLNIDPGAPQPLRVGKEGISLK